TNLIVFNILEYKLVTLCAPEKELLLIIDIVHLEYNDLLDSLIKRSKEFPLFFWLKKINFQSKKDITSDTEYKDAIKKLEKTLLCSMISKYSNYAKKLSSSIYDYESKNWKIDEPHPIEA